MRLNLARIIFRLGILLISCLLSIHGMRAFSHPLLSHPLLNTKVLRTSLLAPHATDISQTKESDESVEAPSLVNEESDDSSDGSCCEDIVEEGMAHVLALDFLWNGIPSSDGRFHPTPRALPVPILLQTSVLRI